MQTAQFKYGKWLILPLLFILASCGFHLRNMLSVPVNLRQVYINAPASNAYNQFVQIFMPIASVNHLTPVNSPQQAQAILEITNITQSGPSLISMTGSGQAGQYALYYAITFSIVDPKGKVLVPSTTMQQSRTFNSNASQILSANSQVQQLNNDMQQTLAQSIIMQLASVSNVNS